MNILIICRCLSIGGAERVAVSWANGLQKLNHKIYILTDTSIPQTYKTDSGIKILSMPNYINNKQSFLNDITARFQLITQIKDIINKYQIDAIIKVMHVNAIELLISRLLSKRKLPIIMTDHNSYERPPSAPMSFKLKLQKFWLNQLFNTVTVLTNRDKEITDKHHLKNVKVLYNPLFLSPIKDEYINRENIILSVGRIDSWHVKGFDILIKAWNLICNEFPHWRLRIVGNGSPSSVDLLYKLSQNKNQIEICGFTENISEEYRNAEIYILSSRFEGWGLGLIEAMSQGCACIACDYHGRQKEIITNKENGLLCQCENIEMLASTIKEMIENLSLRKHIQKNSPLWLNQFSEDRVAEKLEQIILENFK